MASSIASLEKRRAQAERVAAGMSKDFEIIQLEIDEAVIQGLDNRLRNQLMGCMHAHNELTVINRVFMFGTNPAGNGELAHLAASVQMWCLLQVLPRSCMRPGLWSSSGF